MRQLSHRQTGARVLASPLEDIPVSDQPDTLPGKLDGVVPGGTVQQLSFEGVEARDGRPAPVVEDAGRVDEKIAPLLESPTVGGPDVDGPLGIVLVPPSTNDLVLAVDVLPQAVFVGEVVEVGVDFARGGVVGRPIPLGFERVGVVVPCSQ
jgi:hypothetical protein